MFFIMYLNNGQHLTLLLRTSDLEVLEAVLSLLLKPAQRISSQRSLRSGLQASHELIEVLSSPWGLRDNGPLTADSVPHSNILTYQFYKAASGKPTDDHTIDTPMQTPSKGSKNAKPAPVEREGLVTLSIVDPLRSGKSIEAVLAGLMDEHSVPKSHQFALFHKLRVMQSFGNKDIRQMLMVINILALSVYGKFSLCEVRLSSSQYD